MVKIFQEFQFNNNNKVILIGYDLGGAISLSVGLQNHINKSVSQIIAFHPTWTDSIDKLARLPHPTLLLWFAV